MFSPKFAALSHEKIDLFLFNKLAYIHIGSRMPNSSHRNTGSEATREHVTKKSDWFKVFVSENREQIINKIQQETGSNKISKRVITGRAREVWGAMSEQQQMVYAV